MERIIILLGGGDAGWIVLGADGRIHVVHPPRPDELQALTRTLEAASRIQDKGVFESIAATVGHAINAQVGEVGQVLEKAAV